MLENANFPETLGNCPWSQEMGVFSFLQKGLPQAATETLHSDIRSFGFSLRTHMTLGCPCVLTRALACKQAVDQAWLTPASRLGPHWKAGS
jgi:hypothetical protein